MDLLQNIFNNYGLVAGFILLVLENVGVPFPTAVVYLYGIDQIQTNGYSYWYLIFLFSFAHVLGSLLAYYLGLAGNVFVSKKISSNSKITKTKKKIETWYNKYGSISSFFVRFIGYVRPWSSFIAGFGKERFWPFLIWTILGAIIFNSYMMLFSEWLIFIWQNYYWTRFIIIAGFAFSLVGFWFVYPLFNKKKI